MVSCSLTTLFFLALFSLIIVFKWLMSNKLIFIVIVIVIVIHNLKTRNISPTMKLITITIPFFPRSSAFPHFTSGFTNADLVLYFSGSFSVRSQIECCVECLRATSEMYCNVCIVLYCNVLYCIVMYCIVLYYEARY